jgi:hypothetical protein
VPLDDDTRKHILDLTVGITTVEETLTERRLELRDVVRQAHKDGATISDLARALDLSRTRVRQLLEAAELDELRRQKSS